MVRRPGFEAFQYFTCTTSRLGGDSTRPEYYHFLDRSAADLLEILDEKSGWMT